MTTVYIVIHDDGLDYGSEVFGAYLDQAAAEASIVSRTPSGRRSTAYGAHNESCCSIIEREADAPDIDRLHAIERAAGNVSDRRTLMDDGFWVSQKEMRALDIALGLGDDHAA